MQELIKVTTNKQGQQVVSAKALFLFLGMDKSKWSRWSYANIEGNEFAAENEDWIGFTTVVNGNETKDYVLSIDFAKRIAMMTRTTKGEEARNYFLECERIAKQQPSQSPAALSRKEILLLALESEERALAAEAKLIEAETTITEQAPMVDYYKTAMSATDTVDMEGAVKVLGLPFGRNTLLKKLREMKILMPNNHPYQQHVNSGYFKLIQTTYNKPNGSTYTYYKTVVFPKGLDAIKRLLTKSPKNNVQPLFGNSQPATA